MADTKILGSERLSSHKTAVSMAAFTVGVFVFAKLLDIAGGPSGRNASIFLDRIAGLLGAVGVLLVGATLVVAVVDATF